MNNCGLIYGEHTLFFKPGDRICNGIFKAAAGPAQFPAGLLAGIVVVPQEVIQTVLGEYRPGV
jgi:hypothetical protein